MFQNFKTDIIYYNTLTDFELEFNLCGCCRMRLLNDKCSDKKTLLLSLSRAVSRSRVIIVTAPLFAGDNIMGTIASAIGNELEVINNQEFNIVSDTPIEIIKGALPLVTSDGIFGGCIIESGPQSLIILTDNKPVRKNLMKNLIHPYIEEIYAMESLSSQKLNPNEELITEPDPEEEIVSESAEELTAEEPPEEQILTDVDTEDDQNDSSADFYETDTQIVMEGEEDTSEAYYLDDFEELYTESQSESAVINQDDSEGYYCEEDYYTEELPEKKPTALNRWILIISIILLLSIAVLCVCIFYIPSTEGVAPAAYLKDIFDTMFG